MNRPYDHSDKAGNQGDIVKHVVLLAACRNVFSGSRKSFRYVDAFSGPSGSVLLPGGEWTRGVGKVDRDRPVESIDVKRWLGWYLSPPQLVGTRYPGSARIAGDVARKLGKRLSMTLFDTSVAVVDDLRLVFPRAEVVHLPVGLPAVEAAKPDLLFIDPPRLGDLWPTVQALMEQGDSMLAWLPVNAGVVDGRARVSKIAEGQLETVRAMTNVHTTRVLWARGGRTIGCDLAYRCSSACREDIRSAVEEVVAATRWAFKNVEHFD